MWLDPNLFYASISNSIYPNHMHSSETVKCLLCVLVSRRYRDKSWLCLNVIRLQRIYNFWLLHAILSSVLDIIGLYYSLLYYFWANLLTGGPAQNWCFVAYFRVSQKKNIKRSPNGMKPSGAWFLERTRSRRLGPYVREASRRPRGRGRALHPRGPPVAPPTYSFLLYIPTYPQTIRDGVKTLIPPP